MRCLLCGKKLPLLRKLKDPEFCCDAHRQEYVQNRDQLALSRLIDTPARSQPARIEPEAPRRKPRKVALLQVKNHLANFCLLPPEPANSKERASARAVESNPVGVSFWLALPRREKRRRSNWLSLAEKVEMGELTSLAGAAAMRVEPGVATAWAPAGNRLAGVRESEFWKRAMRPEEEPGAGRVMLGADGKPFLVPEAGKVGWPGRWWQGRGMRRERRGLEAQAVALPIDWRPSGLPVLRLEVESTERPDRCERSRTSEGEAGPVRMAHPKPRAPRPARLTRPSGGMMDETAATSFPLRRPAAVLQVAGIRLPWAARVSMSLAHTVVGDRMALKPEQRPLTVRILAAWPEAPATGLGHGLPTGRLASLTLPSANWGGDRVRPEMEELRTQPRTRPPQGQTVPPIRFTPPRPPLFVFRLYPNAGGEAEEWRQKPAAWAREREFAPAPVPRLEATPLCDWVPVMAKPHPSTFVLAYRQGEAKADGAAAFQEAEDTRQETKTARRPGYRGSIAAIPGLGGCAARLRRLPLDEAAPVSWPPTPVGLYEPCAVTPDVRLGRAPWKTFAEWLPGSQPIWKRWGQSLAGVPHWLRRLPAAPKWGAALLAVMLSGYAAWPAGTTHAKAAKEEAPEPAHSAAAPESRAEARRPKNVKAQFWEGFRERILQRAAIQLIDDFRAGLGEWEGAANWAKAWSYDAAGFVRTGPLALYVPSRGLKDYRMEFLGQIERRGLGWAVRAADLQNYYAMKLVIVSPGPEPTVALARYPVIGGVAGAGRQTILSMPLQMDTLYRVETEVHGSNYSVSVQGQMVESWTEKRLEQGGIGLFSGKGELARIRWVGVWHQYDTLGRLCAFLAPGGLPGSAE